MSLDKYTKQLNEIVRPTGNVKKQLLTAIENITDKINRLKEVIFLSEKRELSGICQDAKELKLLMEKLFEGVSRNQIKMTHLLPEVGFFYEFAYPEVEACKISEKRLQMLEFSEHLSSLESSVLAARVMNDKTTLANALKQYFSFVDAQLSANPEIREYILECTEQHETCLNSLTYLMLDFKSLLNKLNIPIVLMGISDDEGCQTWCDDDLQIFCSDFHALSSFNISYLNILLSKPLLADVCLPMHIILSPMEKRFRYHFCGTQKTNRVDMPEWYMSQVLQWIRANDYFLTVVDRDFISVTNESAVSVRLELMRGLVTLLLDKLNYDLGLSTSMPLRFNHKFSSNNYSDCNIPFEVCYPSFHSNSDDELLNNAQHFSHLIDVVLQTDSKLSKMMYPSDYPRPSDVLSHPKVFSRWLLLEQHLASDRLKIALRSSSSWFVVDESEGRPQCVDYFIAILHAISSRGRQLSDKVSQARFVQVQLNLIHEFYFECVVSLARGQPELDASMNRSPYSKSKTEKGNETSNVFRSLFSSHGRSLNSQPRTKKASVINQLFKCFVDGVEDPRSSRWILTMNAMKCLHDVMLEWANDQHYVTFWEDLSTRRLLQFGDPWLKDIGLNTYKTNIMASELKEHESQNEAFNESCSSDTYLGLHGGVFTQMLLLYSSQIKRMLEETVKVVLKDLKEKSSLYIRSSDNWLCDTSESGHLGNIKSENANLMMSTNASVFFHALHDWLYHLSISVHWKLFSHVWKSIASQLDDYFYNELILMNRFTSLGAAQLRFDLTNCLYSLFNLYTERPESFFSQTRDACVLLNLLPGTAELLKDTLNESVSTVRKDDNNPLGSLLELGVYRLTPEEALRILSLRVIVG